MLRNSFDCIAEERSINCDNGVRPRPVADDLIYNAGRSFAIPMLLYKLELGSSIHPEHIDAFHKVLETPSLVGGRMNRTKWRSMDTSIGTLTH